MTDESMSRRRCSELQKCKVKVFDVVGEKLELISSTKI
jgi:hypothetical protein